MYIVRRCNVVEMSCMVVELLGRTSLPRVHRMDIHSTLRT